MSGISFVERYLIGFEDEMTSHCIGSLPELFDSSFINMRYSGDWVFWFQMLLQGDMLEIYAQLNKFRQHTAKDGEPVNPMEYMDS